MRKQVLIVGASGGIGEAAAIKFVEEGYDVHLQYFQNRKAVEKVKEMAAVLGGRCYLYRADVTSSQEVKELFKEVRQHTKVLDAFIYAAGYSEQKLFQWITDEDWEKMMAVNLTGNFYCCREVSEWMVSQKKGVILNLSSIWGVSGAAMEVHYSAAKAAVIGMTKALAQELGPSGIRANCLAPGWVKTQMNKEHGEEIMRCFAEESPLGRVATPEEMAAWLYFLCSDSASFMTGQVVSPNGGVVI